MATGLGALGLAAAVVFSGSGPAGAITSVSEVVQECGQQTVCQLDRASIPNASEVAGSLPEGVRVVVIPGQRENVLPSPALATQFKTATGADTVIVVEDRADDLFFVASDGDSTALASALNSTGVLDTAVIEQALVPVPADNDVPVGGLIAGGIGLAAAVAVAGTVVIARRRRAARADRRGVATRRLEHDLEEALTGADGAFVREAIDRLHQRAAALPGIGAQLSSLAGHVSELFVRVRVRGTDQQVRLLQSQYKDTLGKLLKALGDDYYGDIIANPQYWSDPRGRADEVLRAVHSVDHQAVENIRQVNESRDLDFKVALDSLNATVTEAKLSDVYSDRAGTDRNTHDPRN